MYINYLDNSDFCWRGTRIKEEREGAREKRFLQDETASTQETKQLDTVKSPLERN